MRSGMQCQGFFHLRSSVALCTMESMAKIVKDKDPAAVALGRRGGLARAANLTLKQRRDGARKAALARWRNVKARKAKST